MSPSKLDFLNRAHIQFKIELGNAAGRAELAGKLRIVLAAAGIESCALPESILSLRSLTCRLFCSERFSSDYLARVVAALKVSQFQAVKRSWLTKRTLATGTHPHYPRRSSPWGVLFLLA